MDLFIYLFATVQGIIIIILLLYRRTRPYLPGFIPSPTLTSCLPGRGVNFALPLSGGDILGLHLDALMAATLFVESLWFLC